MFFCFLSSRVAFSPARYSSTCPPSSFFIPRHHYCHFCASRSSIYIHLRTTTSHTKRMLMHVSSKVHWRNSAINNAMTTTFRGSWITCMVCWIFESITFYWSRRSYLHSYDRNNSDGNETLLLSYAASSLKQQCLSSLLHVLNRAPNKDINS